jgi:hypothetical protein
MPQRVLDPADTTTNGTWVPPGPIPKSLRSFGRFPDIDQWWPGDLILVSAAIPGYLSRQIRAAQEYGGYAADDARWHHAAVYVGDGRICEALGSGVRTSLVYKYVGTHSIRVRRDLRVSAAEGYKIAVTALFRMRSDYSFWTVVRMLYQSRRGFHGEPVGLRFASSRAVICSMLYADAYSLVTQRVLGNTAGDVPTPAFLSSTTQLQDVACSWRSIG